MSGDEFAFHAGEISQAREKARSWVGIGPAGRTFDTAALQAPEAPAQTRASPDGSVSVWDIYLAYFSISFCRVE